MEGRVITLRAGQDGGAAINAEISDGPQRAVLGRSNVRHLSCGVHKCRRNASALDLLLFQVSDRRFGNNGYVSGGRQSVRIADKSTG